MKRFANNAIVRGDRIYVCVRQDFKIVLEFSIDNVGDMTELIGEVRYAAKRLEGLAQLCVRNHSRGWSMVRPMMFYSSFPTPARAEFHRAMREASESLRRRNAERKMLFPWETH